MASAILITPAASGSNLACPATDIPTASKTAKFQYSEALHKIFYYYEAIRAGNLTGNAIKRPLWRSDSFGDVKSVPVPGSNATVDASGGYMDSSSRLKYGQPLAFTWTTISWGAIQYRNGYERTGEMIYLVDAIKWAAKYFISIHPEPNKLIGQVGNAQVDSQFCGPSEDFNSTRNVYWLTENNPGSEVAAETAAALASGSIVVGWTDPVLSQQMIDHAKQLYLFAKNFNGTVSKSIPESAQSYPSSGFEDELAWAAIWLYRATSNYTYLLDAEKYHADCCSYYSGYGFSYDEKNAGLNVLMSQLTTKRKYTQLAKGYFDQWLPGDQRTIFHTKFGLGFRSEWGTLRYSVNTAFLMMVFADFLQLEEGISGKNYTENSYQKKLFDYAVSQVDYVLGSNKFNRSYLIGFGNNSTAGYYHMGSFYPVANFSRNQQNCAGNFYNSGASQTAVLYGALMGGPSISDDFPFGRRDSPQRSQPIQDYPAALTGALSKLIDFYGTPSYCGEMDYGLNLNVSSLGPVGINSQQIWCKSPTSFTYPTTATTSVSGSENCFVINNWDTDTEGWTISKPPLGDETGVSWVNESLRLDWFIDEFKPADFFVSTYDGSGHGFDFSKFPHLKMDVVVPKGTIVDLALTITTQGWTEFDTEHITLGPDVTSKLNFNLQNISGIDNVWGLMIVAKSNIAGTGYILVDNLRVCKEADAIGTSTVQAASSRSRGTNVRPSTFTYVDENVAAISSVNWFVLSIAFFWRFL